MLFRSCLLLLMAACALLRGSEPFPRSLREQSSMQQEWLKTRLDVNLPALMRKHHVSMCIYRLP